MINLGFYSELKFHLHLCLGCVEIQALLKASGDLNEDLRT